jgi:hypothetical protein
MPRYIVMRLYFFQHKLMSSRAPSCLFLTWQFVMRLYEGDCIGVAALSMQPQVGPQATFVHDVFSYTLIFTIFLRYTQPCTELTKMWVAKATVCRGAYCKICV